MAGEMEEEPAANNRNKVDITVAGHAVVVDSDSPLDEVEACAKRLFAWSAGYAKASTVGFASAPPATERLPEDFE